MTREEFEKKLENLLGEVIKHGYGKEHAEMIRKDVEEVFAKVERGELPVSILEDFLDPSKLMDVVDVYPPDED